MICPRCGSSLPLGVSRCTACGAAFAHASVATGLVAIDTTGLPPGASFGASGDILEAPGDAATSGATAGAVTNGTTGLDSSSKPAGGPLKVGQAFSPRY